MAMQELEVLAAGDNPSVADYSDGVDWLNTMISNWEADESMAMKPNLLIASFPTVAGTPSYTCGSGGTAFAARPIRIVNAYSSYQSVDKELIIQGKADYNKLQNKTVAGRPCTLYYIPSYVGVIVFDRVPDAIYTINCDLESPMGDYADQDALLNVSPEYRAAILYNLAVTLAPIFKAVLRPQTAANAKRTLERVQYQANNTQFMQAMPSSDLIV
jgi:hypothetical protein